MKVPSNPPPDSPPYDFEFRSTVDDAWYNARVLLEDDTLVVKFLNFYESSDERFRAGDFQNAEAVDEFLRRLRPLSQQLQDSQCSSLIEGKTVCASFSFGPDEILFYDAIVEAVHNVEHTFEKEEEECLCTFLLFWQHGPNEGNITSTSIANICLVQPFAQSEPTLASFSKMAKEKADRKSSLSLHGLQFKGGVRQSGSFVATKEGKISLCHERNLQDIDLGGESRMGETGSHHFILLENLEKDLSPSSIIEFIHKQMSISPQAYVFPSLSSESFARGAIVLDCKEKLKKLNEFLNNPDHIVTSSRGRPWVITEKFARCGTFRTTRGSLKPISQSELKNRSIDGELKVARRGHTEYSAAKRLRELFIDFAEHQQRLHKRLALEEKKILQPSAEI